MLTQTPNPKPQTPNPKPQTPVIVRTFSETMDRPCEYEGLKTCPTVVELKALITLYVMTQFEDNDKQNEEAYEEPINNLIRDGKGVYLEHLLRRPHCPPKWKDFTDFKGILGYEVFVPIDGPRTLAAKRNIDIGKEMPRFSGCIMRSINSDEIIEGIISYKKPCPDGLFVVFSCAGDRFEYYAGDPSFAIFALQKDFTRDICLELLENFDFFIDNVPVYRALICFLESRAIEPCEPSNIVLDNDLSELLIRHVTMGHQRTAILEALGCNHFHLIRGPPGTGKTTILAYLAFFALMSGKRYYFVQRLIKQSKMHLKSLSDCQYFMSLLLFMADLFYLDMQKKMELELPLGTILLKKPKFIWKIEFLK